MKVVIKCRIEIIQRSTPQNPGYRGNGTRQKNNFEARCQIVLSKDAVNWVKFKEVSFSTNDMCIRRASSIGHSYKTIANNRISLPIYEDLVGNYNLVKLDEDTFQLVKIEENENRN